MQLTQLKTLLVKLMLNPEKWNTIIILSNTFKRWSLASDDLFVFFLFLSQIFLAWPRTHTTINNGPAFRCSATFIYLALDQASSLHLIIVLHVTDISFYQCNHNAVTPEEVVSTYQDHYLNADSAFTLFLNTETAKRDLLRINEVR